MPALEQPVVGYRLWLSASGGLSALSGRGEWFPGVNTARCVSPSFSWVQTARDISNSLLVDTIPPHQYCSCGLHAYHELDNAEAQAYQVAAPVVGAVLLYGKMFAGENVIRAEKAEILALCPIREFCTPSSTYKVPLVSNLEDLTAIALEHGEPWNSNLISP